MDDSEIQNKMFNILTQNGSMCSNELFRKIGGNKTRNTKIRKKSTDEGWIKAEKKGREMLLTLSKFEADKFKEHDWTWTTRTNCSNWLKYFKNNKPLFRVRMNKPFKIKKEIKMWLDAYFHELDRQMIVCTRVVNAEALGLITSTRSRKVQKECIDLVQDFIKKLLNDHKEFKDEIKEYAQSQLRTVQFKI